MDLWRLYRKAHGPGIDGAGGRYASGRWHTQGKPVAYFGANAAIIVLEKLAHLNPDVLPSDLMMGHFIADLSVESAWPGAPPKDFEIDIDLTRGIGDAWLSSNTTCVLRVPSVIIPEEINLVFNPLHADAGKIKLIGERAFEFDARLLS